MTPRQLVDLMSKLYGSEQLPVASLVDKIIQFKQLLVNCEEEPDERARLFFSLGSSLNARFMLTGFLDDLERAISALQRAVELTSDEDPNQTVRLGGLAEALYERFRRIGALDDCESAITALCCAVESASDTDSRMPFLLTSYGRKLLLRFCRLGDPEDMECGIMILSRADELVSDGHPFKPECLSSLGLALIIRFDHTGQLESLGQAIFLLCRAVGLTPDGHPDKPSMFEKSGYSFFKRCNCTRDPHDLEQAISAHRHAVELTPDGHPDKPSRLHSLGRSLQMRFERTGELEDIRRAISSHRHAVELTPDGHPDKPSRLNTLGGALHLRFGRTGELEDIRQAISAQRFGVELTPDGHPAKPGRLSGLGSSLLVLFQHIGQLESLEEGISLFRRAIELTPDGHLDKLAFLNNLGLSLYSRFKYTGRFQDLEQAILMHQCVVDLTPENLHGKPSWFRNRGISLIMRFEQTGELDNLEQGILAHRHAVELTSEGDPDKPSRLKDLGASLRTRFEHLGELKDLEQAISICHCAVELTPDGHPEKPSLFNALSGTLYVYFYQTRNLDDLERAISFARRAAKLTADEHPSKPMLLANICQLLHDRFNLTHETTHVGEAISAGYRAIETVPKGHSTLSRCYIALALGLQSRFECQGDIGDIKEAISLLNLATASITDSDPSRTKMLCDLSLAQEKLFERTQTKMDFDALVESCVKATLHPSASPSHRLTAARKCVFTLLKYPSFTTTESLLSAHSRIIDILPEIVWLGHDIHRRYEESSQQGKLVNDAVVTAVDAGVLERAVEWLEVGRALIWSQVIALRTPLDELRASYPQYADSLQSIRQQLQSSAHSTFAHDVKVFGGIDGLARVTVNSAADRHRGLVIEYDKVMKNIRACLGFEDFLLPKRFEFLVPSPALLSSHIVFIHVHWYRCDAIVISPSGDIKGVFLPDLSIQRAAELQKLWTEHVTGGRDCAQRGLGSVGDLEGELNPSVYYLKHMWTWIVQPILVALDLATLTRDERLPHIIWCSTGPLMQLPLHAAGIYDEPHGPRVYDFVVSSYTPSLSALKRSLREIDEPQATRDVLIVTQPSTPGHIPLPGTVLEGSRLRDTLAASGITSKWLNDEAATVQEVRAVMKEHPWVHFACHGSQNRADATQSAFHLFDGSLTLADLMGTASNNAELAFLSACETAVGDEATPEESAHLAAGMLAVGFKGVIATMWSIQDADAPIVVEAYYKVLLALRSAGRLGNGETGAAYALHEATRVLREQVGETSFMRWVPFVHFGV
ncbi:hypothetical protein PENSPDRAFT_749706 [Peniophora sp. CONT]|nr:hypothetical protein PENSPDRAFT_749706 [Peniophora sp. CONT]